MTTPDDPDVEQLEERLDDLQRGIDDARTQAEEHGTLPDTTPEPTFADPDGDGDVDEDAPGAIGG